MYITCVIIIIGYVFFTINECFNFYRQTCETYQNVRHEFSQCFLQVFIGQPKKLQNHNFV